VNFATQNGTAVAPSDYGSRLGTLTFNPGVTSRDIVVTIKGGNVVEPTEHFFMNLSGPVNATISDAQGQATIQDDD
jgi:serralysin